LNIETTVLILGSGFSGLVQAAKLKDAGVNDLKIIDKASDFGGTVSGELIRRKGTLLIFFCRVVVIVVLEPLVSVLCSLQWLICLYSL
jgi:heterodisulfide reductase subunit A-like polyferredoxin